MKRLTLFCVLLTLSTNKAFAYSECTQKVVRIWAGDGGHVWIRLDNGVAAIMSPTDPNKSSVLAMAITAMTTGRTVTARFTADGVCAAPSDRMDFTGMYLN